MRLGSNARWACAETAKKKDLEYSSAVSEHHLRLGSNARWVYAETATTKDDEDKAEKHLCWGCGLSFTKKFYSKREWKLGEEGICLCCQQKIKEMEINGLILQRNHFVSNGLVDGYQHRVEGKIRFDHAMHANPDNKKLADDALSDFLLMLNIKLTSIDNMEESMQYDSKSYLAFKGMNFHSAQEPIPEIAQCDFLTTVHKPAVHHKKFRNIPKSSGKFEMGTFYDSPSMSAGLPLKFLCKKGKQQYITSFPEGRIIRDFWIRITSLLGPGAPHHYQKILFRNYTVFSRRWKSHKNT